MKKLITTLVVSLLAAGSFASANSQIDARTEKIKNAIIDQACAQNINKNNEISINCDLLAQQFELTIATLTTVSQLRSLLEKQNQGSRVTVSCFAATTTDLSCNVIISEGDDQGHKDTHYVQSVKRQTDGQILLGKKSNERVQFID